MDEKTAPAEVALEPTQEKEVNALSKTLSEFVETIKEFLSTVKAGARHSKSDSDMLQGIHDNAVSLGAECMGKMSVVKQADGKLRWVMFSSTAYQDRDGEIVSQKALAEDVARADASKEYGPLDWWHTDIVIGDCDYNAMIGPVLLESGTFTINEVGEAVKASADSLGGSIAFYHPASEPRDGVYNNIRRFRRALLPKDKASNLFTQLTVKEPNMEMTQEKYDEFAKLLKNYDLAKSIVAQAEGVEKAADLAGVKRKAAQESEASDAPPAPKTIGHMTEADLKEFIQKCMGDMGKAKEAEAKEELHTKATKELAEELVKVKNLQAVASKRVGELEKQIAELSGEQPRINTQGYRATQDPATIRSDKQAPPTGPQADPNFLKFLTGVGAQ